LVSSLAFLAHESRQQTVRRPGIRAATIRDHDAITRAVARRDEEGAAAAMGRHLRNLRAASGVASLGLSG
jgi:DNA-binding GntR family transcriptional regulator